MPNFSPLLVLVAWCALSAPAAAATAPPPSGGAETGPAWLERVTSPAAVAAAGRARGLHPDTPGRWTRSGRVIARLGAGDRAALLDALRPHLVRYDAEVREVIVRVPPGIDEDVLCAALVASGAFDYAHPDWRLHAAAVPDDPLFAAQWHHPVIGAPSAWDTSVGDASVVIAVCDSGIELEHDDLVANLVPGYNAVDEVAEADGGAVDGLTDHGTQVAGVAGAVGNNGAGVTGVAWSVGLMPIRVSNQPTDTALLSDINAGARWAADHGAHVVNVSFSGVHIASVETTGAYLREQGAGYVWAAGNAGGSLGTADPQSVLVVAATDEGDAPASFTNFGRGIDVAAPGVNILTTKLGDDYGTINGTSFSAPITAGVIALVRAIHPGLTPAAAEAVVLLSAADLGAPGEDDTFGYGRVDAAAAARLASDALTLPLDPIAFDDEVNALGSGPVFIDVLANDMDLNGDAIEIVAFDVASAAGGTVTSAGGPTGTLMYTPPAAFQGIDTFGYTIADETGAEASGIVRVGIAPAPSFTEAIVEAPGFSLPMAVHAADLDGDGDDDVVTVHLGTLGTLEVYEHVGAGVFEPAWSIGLPVNSIVVDFADVNADGCVDLVIAERFADRLAVALGACDFTFGPFTETVVEEPIALVARDITGAPLDFNNDDHADVVVARGGFPNGVGVWLGDGTGAFVAAPEYDPDDVPGTLAAADLDGDGRPEVVIGGGGFGFLTTLEVTPGGAILERFQGPTGAIVADLVVAHLDGDGILDVATVSTGVLGAVPGVRVFRGDGAAGMTFGLLLTATGQFPQALAAGDFDGDGDGDVATANLLSNEVTVHPGIGAGGFLPVAASLEMATGAVDIVGRDFDFDGDVDLVVAAIGVLGDKRIHVFLNDADPTPGDLDGDGVVGFTDLLMVLEAWGACAVGDPCPEDIDGDRVVGGSDLRVVLAGWSS